MLSCFSFCTHGLKRVSVLSLKPTSHLFHHSKGKFHHHTSIFTTKIKKILLFALTFKLFVYL